MFEHHASHVIMDLTILVANAMTIGDVNGAKEVSDLIEHLEIRFPEAKAELDERYPQQREP